jgi:hypothetical protein
VLFVVRTLAAEAPVIVAVDDLAWLDGPSARVLAYALRRVGDARVGFASTVRADEPDAELPVLATEVAVRVRRLHLPPLDLAAIDALVRRDAGLSLRRPALAWLHGASGGNPFIALEIARAMQRSGARPGLAGLALPTSPGALVRDRLASLPASTRWPLAAAAALGPPLIATLTVAYPEAAPALEVARHAGVVDLEQGMVRFAHPLLAAGAYGSLDAGERRELHGRLADAAHEPEQRARHLALAIDRPSEAVAAELESAAASARARGGPDAAAELWLQAAMRTPADDPDGIRRRTIAAGGYFIQAGDPTRARTVLEAYVAATEPGPGRADALRVLADARSSDDWHEKERLLEQAMAEAGEDHRLRSEILQALAQASRYTLRGSRLEVELATAAVAEAEAQDDPVARCSAYLTAVFAHRSAGDGLEADLLDRARTLAPEVEHLRIFLQPAFCAALIDESDDRLEQAAASLAVLRARAEAAGDWDSLPLVANNLAYAEYRLGAWQDAHAHAVEGERRSRVNGQALALAFALNAKALVESGLGRTSDARSTAEEALTRTLEIGAVSAEHAVRTTRGVLALAEGDLEGAEAELCIALDAEVAAGYGAPTSLGGHRCWRRPWSPSAAPTRRPRSSPGTRRPQCAWTVRPRRPHLFASGASSRRPTATSQGPSPASPRRSPSTNGCLSHSSWQERSSPRASPSGGSAGGARHERRSRLHSGSSTSSGRRAGASARPGSSRAPGTASRATPSRPRSGRSPSSSRRGGRTARSPSCCS